MISTTKLKCIFVEKAVNTSISAAQCCKAIELTSSTYYSAKSWPISATQKKRKRMQQHILEIHRESKEIYGSSRIHKALAKRDITCSKATVANLMHENEIRARRKPAFKPTTTLSNHKHPIAERMFDNDEVKAEKPHATKHKAKYVTARSLL